MNDNKRPDGSVATTFGWTLIVAGVACAFFAAKAETVNMSWLMFAAGNLGISLGVLLVSLGYLVKAIWYLPAREINESVDETPAPSPCDWCGQVIAAPNKPCAAFETERLKTFIPQIKNPKCLLALQDRGVIAPEDTATSPAP